MGEAVADNANPHALDLWEQAAAAPKGIRVHCSSKKEAEMIRFRMYTVRRREQTKARKLYAPDDPQFGRTPFDTYRVTIEAADGAYHLHIAIPSVENLRIEEIK